MSPDPIGGLGVVKLQNTVARLPGRGGKDIKYTCICIY